MKDRKWASYNTNAKNAAVAVESWKVGCGMEEAKDSGADVEQLKKQKDIRRALKQTATARESAAPVKTKHKIFVGAYALALFALGGVYYLLRLRFFGFAAKYVPLAQRLTLGAMAIVVVLAAAKMVDAYAISRMDDDAAQYNLRRVLKLVAGLMIAFIVISILFANWYTAAVSLGLGSLILGFALQTPITSFIGWIYILVKTPYRAATASRSATRRAM